MKSLRCLHRSLSQQKQSPLSWECKAAVLGPCQFSARLRPLLGMRISWKYIERKEVTAAGSKSCCSNDARAKSPGCRPRMRSKVFSQLALAEA
ncbi:hypothetical protein LAZ67_8002085 [Cordylochernes scorpioides]|uniref:Uncharacterized protein n=1 Tax=Cordylochernes scorpioides TaxID=51811 RepID=A0ABY6KTH9_9ARAC|nr:hypothetical protein LAZ67_8002085 [Cordylochernes scorpioides]